MRDVFLTPAMFIRPGDTLSVRVLDVKVSKPDGGGAEMLITTDSGTLGLCHDKLLAVVKITEEM